MPAVRAQSLWIFSGADRARKLQRLQELERALQVQPLDRHQVDGAQITPKALLALCRQQPAASPVRLVVVDHFRRTSVALRIDNGRASVLQIRYP